MNQAESQQDGGAPEIDACGRGTTALQPLKLKRESEPEQECEQRVELAIDEYEVQEFDQLITAGCQSVSLFLAKKFPAAEKSNIGQEDPEQREAPQGVQYVVALGVRDGTGVERMVHAGTALIRRIPGAVP